MTVSAISHYRGGTVVQYADSAAYEKAQAAIAQDPEYQQAVAEIAKIAKRIDRQLVSDLDL